MKRAPDRPFLVRHRKVDGTMPDRLQPVRTRAEADRLFVEWAYTGEPGDTLWIHRQPLDPAESYGMVIRWKTIGA